METKFDVLYEENTPEQCWGIKISTEQFVSHLKKGGLWILSRHNITSKGKNNSAKILTTNMVLILKQKNVSNSIIALFEKIEIDHDSKLEYCKDLITLFLLSLIFNKYSGEHCVKNKIIYDELKSTLPKIKSKHPYLHVLQTVVETNDHDNTIKLSHIVGNDRIGK